MNNPVRTSIAVLISMSIIFGVVLCFMFIGGNYLYSLPLMFFLFGNSFLMLAMRKFSNNETHEGSLLVKRSTTMYFVGFTILFLMFFMNLDFVVMVVCMVIYALLSLYFFCVLKKIMRYG